jgi:hypothetical protein
VNLSLHGARWDLDRTTRNVVVVSTLATIFIQWLIRRNDPIYLMPLVVLTPIILNRLSGSITLGCMAVLPVGAIVPALVRDRYAVNEATTAIYWTAAVLGLALSTGAFRRWALPARWRPPLALWALCLAWSWPAIVAREADFSLRHLMNGHAAITSGGISPPFIALWISHVAGLQMTAILWADALFAAFPFGHLRRFERSVVWPLGAGALASIGVGLYQMRVDPFALNPTVYGVLGRAAGLLLDGNAFGTVCAMWIAGFSVLALRSSGALRLLAVVSAALAAVTLWGSGSRTALLAALASGSALVYVTGKLLIRSSMNRSQKLLAASGAVAAIVLAGLAAVAGTETTGPASRIRPLVLWLMDRGPAPPLARYLWERDGYGSTAVRIIADQPAVGIGVGTFHALVIDYSHELIPRPPVGGDNAQNWIRHQLAELGLIGSVGWAAFMLMLFASLIRGSRPSREPAAIVVAGAIVGLGLASMLGMPTQHALVLMTCWTFIAWHHQLRHATGSGTESAPPRRAWIEVTAIAVAFVAVTLYAARTDLRVPNRAVRFGWPYWRGFTDPIERGDERFRRTADHSVAVLEARGPYLKLTFWAEHPDVRTAPVALRIWRGSERIANVSLTTQSPVIWYVRTAAERNWMLLEMEVDRTWTDTSQGSTLPEYGVSVADWEFVDVPPAGSAVIE